MLSTGSNQPRLGGLLLFALGVGSVGSFISFVVLALLGMRLELIQFNILLPGQHPPPIAPKEYATWVMVVGLAIFVGWAIARIAFNFGKELAGSAPPL